MLSFVRKVTAVLCEDEASGEVSVAHLRKAGGSAVSRDAVAECVSLAKKQAGKIRKMLDKASPIEDFGRGGAKVK